MLVRARAQEIDWRLWTDGAIAALGTAALGTAFIFDFVADRTTGTTLEVATSLAYPLGDVGMLAMIVGVIALTGWHPGRTWSLLLAGLGALVVADIAYTVQASGGFVPPGNWIDPIYLISATCIGAILWQPSVSGNRADGPRQQARADGPRDLRRRDDRPLRDAVHERHQRAHDHALGSDDARRDRPAWR